MKKMLNTLGVALAAVLAFGFMAVAFDHARKAPIDGIRIYNSAEVLDVVPGSPADKAGVKRGDLVTRIDGENINSFQQLYAKSRSVQLGKTYEYEVTRDEQLIPLRVTIGPPPFPAGNFLGMAVGLFLVACALAGFARSPGEESSRVFLVASLFLAMAATVLGDWTRIAGNATLIKVYLLPVMMLPGLMLHFLLVFPERNRFAQGLGPGTLLVHLPGIALYAILLAGLRRHVTAGGAISPTFLTANAWIVYAGVLLGVAFFGLGAVNLYNTMRTTGRTFVREQAKWVLLGLAGVPLFFAIAAVQILAKTDRLLAGSFFPFAVWAGFGALQVAMVLAIYRTRLDDVDRIIRTTVAYALTFLFCAGLYQMLIAVLGNAGARWFGLDQAEVYSVSALLAMAVFYPISRTLSNVTESFVAQDKFNVADKMRALSQRYAELIDPPELYRETLTAMLNAVQSESGAVFAWSEKSLAYKPAAAEKIAPTLEVNSNSPLIPLLRGKQLFTRGDGQAQDETPDAELRRIGAEIALPLISKGDLLGFVVLGARAGGHIYSNQDVEALGNAARELSVRLEQAKSYHQQRAEIERLRASAQDKDAELANAQSRVAQIQRAFSFDLLEVLVLADAAALGAPARDFLGEHFEADLETEVPKQARKRYVGVVVLLSFADSLILKDLRRLKRLFPDAPIIGLMGEGKRADIAYGKHPEIDLVLEGKENIPEVIYRLYRVRHSAPIGKTEVIIYKHKSLSDIVKAVQERAGPSLQPVLLTGEQGVGKTTVAKLIHQWSGERAFGPFVRAELRKCDPKRLPEMLFGLDGTPGKFGEARGGTLFLDDIDCLPYTAQTQLLEVLATKELPVEAGFHGQAVDVRIVSSTPGTMEHERQVGKFREDLYYKLSVERFDIPPLRDRREDVKLLISAFLDNYNRQNRTNVLMPKISQMVLFENYRWPGNVTEMERRVYRAAGFLGAGESLVFEDRRAQEAEGFDEEVVPLAEAVRRTTQAAVQQAIAIAKGNLATAASMLQVAPQELDKTLRDLRTK